MHGEYSVNTHYYYISWGFPGDALVNNLPTNAGDVGSIPGSGRSRGVGNDNPLQYSCLEKSHGQRSLAGYSSQGCKELDMTEDAQTIIYHTVLE